MSLASLIISLGLLVDNGIVVAEEFGNRIQRGQERIAAAIDTGKSLSNPLLAASLTTILAFMPLMLAPGGAGEYTRSISLVIAIALAGELDRGTHRIDLVLRLVFEGSESLSTMRRHITQAITISTADLSGAA